MSFPFSPSDCGLPAKFREWRPQQTIAIERIFGSPYRFIPLAIPTGGGKSVVYVAAALLEGLRTVILTATKALQDQLMGDFAQIGMLDCRGRANYDCITYSDCSCEEGSHMFCVASKSEMCPYNSDHIQFINNQLGVTNYAHWIAVHRYGPPGGLGKVDMLVLDEAHNAAEEVTASMASTITHLEAYDLLDSGYPQPVLDFSAWQKWAANQYPLASREVDRLKREMQGMTNPSQYIIRRLRHWNELATKLDSIATSQGRWEVEPVSDSHKTGRKFSESYRLEPLWARHYTEAVLFRGIQRIVPVSATLRPKTLDILGIDKSAYRQFQEFPTMFPASRCPMYYLPTIQYSYETDEDDLEFLVNRIDSIIAGRLDRKGIIHSVSYKRQQQIRSRSLYSGYMLLNESGNTAKTINDFRAAKPPCVLVSPSITEGYDFPYSDCEYQIHPKVPFVRVEGSRIMEARCGMDHRRDGRSGWKKRALAAGADPGYADYLMAQAIVQACGRGMRAIDDQCENFLLDRNWGMWVYPSLKHHFPLWFLRQVRDIVIPPNAPPPLKARARLEVVA